MRTFTSISRERGTGQCLLTAQSCHSFSFSLFLFVFGPNLQNQVSAMHSHTTAEPSVCFSFLHTLQVELLRNCKVLKVAHNINPGLDPRWDKQCKVCKINAPIATFFCHFVLHICIFSVVAITYMGFHDHKAIELAYRAGVNGGDERYAYLANY